MVHSVDGAVHLTDVTPPGAGTLNTIVGLTSIDSAHAWVTAQLAAQYPGRGVVYRTRDGGATWTSAVVSNDQIGDMTFVDARHGWMQASRLVDHGLVNRMILSRTLDAGVTRTVVYRERQRTNVQTHVQTGDCQWSLVRFNSPLDGLAGLDCYGTAAPLIATTSDGGKTWQRVALPALRHSIRTVLWTDVQRPELSGQKGAAFVSFCVRAANGCTVQGSLYRSYDGGKTWSAGHR